MGARGLRHGGYLCLAQDHLRRKDGTMASTYTMVGYGSQGESVRRLQSDWESRNGRSPTVSELAQAAGLTVEEVAACEQADVSVDSFERELSGGGRVGDLVGDEGMEERTCLHLSLHEALQDLPDRDRQVLSLRYSRDLTQQQVSRIVGVSQVQVSRIEKRAIEKLREMLRE